uniref:Uncharacterized protein n=1 Tax=Lepeophtheirus salmonis TaxID=72036 RepID=A0A0K2TF00_LEPSM
MGGGVDPRYRKSLSSEKVNPWKYKHSNVNINYSIFCTVSYTSFLL